MNHKKPIHLAPGPAMELSEFLLSLPAISKRGQQYSKGVLHVCFPNELGTRLKSLTEAVSQFGHAPFRPETLMCHLLEEFLSAHQPGIDALLVAQAHYNSQQQREKDALLDELLDSF